MAALSMDDQASAPPPLIEWAVAARPLPGESESGDLYVVKPCPNGVLVAAVDGLGHGPWAADAARTAAVALQDYRGEPLVSLVQFCHERLKGTRGVVMTLAKIDAEEDTVTWLGVGNVEAMLQPAGGQHSAKREYVLLRGGVVGEQMPSLRASVVPLHAGDTLFFTTDGVAHGFADGLNLSEPPQWLADQILASHGKSTDDALVLVVRYLGRSA